MAKFIQRRNPVPCGGFNNARLKKLGVRILGRAINCSGREMDFNNGSVSDMDIVIWSVGYAERVDWIKLEDCFDEAGWRHNRGVTTEPGLYLVGRKWLSCRASELVMGTENDVMHVMDDVVKYLALLPDVTPCEQRSVA